MPTVSIQYQWRYYCPIRGKHLTTSHWTTEESIRIEHPDAVPVPGTRKELELCDDPWRNCTSAFLRNSGQTELGRMSQAREVDSVKESSDMCGRYALYGPHSRLREKMLLEECPEYGERYNIAPQSNVLVIRFKPGVGRVGQLVKWGLVPKWADELSIGLKLTNARGESVADKPLFRTSFARHRCLIPANGFYEWKEVAGQKQPYYIHPKAPDDYFAFAGLLAAKDLPDGQTLVTTCIITTEPNDLVKPIHDRMPVMIPPDQFDAWLAPDMNDVDRLKALIKPAQADQMVAYPVSRAVNQRTVEGPECIVPVEA